MIDPGSKQSLVQHQGTLPTTGGQSRNCELLTGRQTYSSSWDKQRAEGICVGKRSEHFLVFRRLARRGQGSPLHPQSPHHSPVSVVVTKLQFALTCQHSGTRKAQPWSLLRFLPLSVCWYEVKTLTVRAMSLLIIISPTCLADEQIQLCLCPGVSKAGCHETVHHTHKIREGKKHFKRCLKHV